MKDFSASFQHHFYKFGHFPTTNFSRPKIIFWRLFSVIWPKIPAIWQQ
jgi:hypothetical protein